MLRANSNQAGIQTKGKKKKGGKVNGADMKEGNKEGHERRKKGVKRREGRELKKGEIERKK